MSEIIKYIFLKLFSFSPLLTISFDENFGSVSRKIAAKNAISKFRFSLLSLRIGESAYYFLSIKEKKFNFFCKISIPDLLSWGDDKEIDEEYGKFGKKLYEIGEKEKVNMLSEFYANEVNKLENGFNQTFNKCLAYIALVAFIAPFYLSFLTTIEINNIWVYIVLLSTVFYYLGNIFLLIISFIKVKIYRYLRESEIHKYDDMERTRTLLYFHTFKILQKKSKYHVSIVTNIERYIKFFVFVTLGTWVLLFLWQFIIGNQLLESNNRLKEDYEVININLNVHNDSSFALTNKMELSKIDKALDTNNLQIILLYSDKTPATLNENLTAYININITKDSELIYLKDKSMETNRYKILIRKDEK